MTTPSADIEVVEVLRRGPVCSAYKVRDPHGRLAVLKVLMDPRESARFDREIDALRRLNEAGCPGVVALLDADPAPVDRRPWYRMAWCSGGPMARRGVDGVQWAEPYAGDVDRVAAIGADLARTLAFLHHQRMAFGDLHAGNVLLAANWGRPMLGDFGSVVSNAGRSDRLKDVSQLGRVLSAALAGATSDEELPVLPGARSARQDALLAILARMRGARGAPPPTAAEAEAELNGLRGR